MLCIKVWRRKMNKSLPTKVPKYTILHLLINAYQSKQTTSKNGIR